MGRSAEGQGSHPTNVTRVGVAQRLSQAQEIHSDESDRGNERSPEQIRQPQRQRYLVMALFLRLGRGTAPTTTT